MVVKRGIGSFEVTPVGYGCMSLSHAYGTPPDVAEGVRLLHHALDLGYDFLDTAALYGFGANETLLGEALAARRGEYVLASKCGMTGVNGKRVIDGRPETLKRTIDESLQRLRVDVIDLYYLHRWDKAVPIEDSIGALAEILAAGKIRGIGVSEVSGATLRRAHAVHPITAIQNEYSPWSRNAELGALETARELGVAFVAFSPVARGFLADGVHDPAALVERDIRRGMPRFQAPHFEKNLKLLGQFRALAREAGCAPAQLSLAWVLSRGPHVVAIPGTVSAAHQAENLAAAGITVDPAILARVDALFPPNVAGPRYPAGTLAEIDTEEFA
ncbi:MAG TPA: aldo/keto reductase [Sphingomonadaceae bacterium]|nr:aldo/keto reductase [Sphingomonadaceae bacterium]